MVVVALVGDDLFRLWFRRCGAAEDAVVVVEITETAATATALLAINPAAASALATA